MLVTYGPSLVFRACPQSLEFRLRRSDSAALSGAQGENVAFRRWGAQGCLLSDVPSISDRKRSLATRPHLAYLPYQVENFHVTRQDAPFYPKGTRVETAIAKGRRQHFDRLSDQAERFYVYYWYVVVWVVKSVLTFMATAICVQLCLQA